MSVSAGVATRRRPASTTRHNSRRTLRALSLLFSFAGEIGTISKFSTRTIPSPYRTERSAPNLTRINNNFSGKRIVGFYRRNFSEFGKSVPLRQFLKPNALHLVNSALPRSVSRHMAPLICDKNPSRRKTRRAAFPRATLYSGLQNGLDTMKLGAHRTKLGVIADGHLRNNNIITLLFQRLPR